MTYVPRTNQTLTQAAYHDLTYSPVGLWQFNGDLTDSSGNGQNLPLTAGSERYAELGNTGLKGFYSNGTTYMKRVGHDAALTLTGGMTFEVLVQLPNAPAAASGAWFVNFGEATDSEAENLLYAFGLTGTGEFFYFAEYGPGTNVFWTSTGVGVPAGVPFHYAATRSSDGTTVKFYVNGKLYATASGLTAPTGGSESKLVFFDNNSLAPESVPVNGTIFASAKIIGRELTASEILSEFNRTLGRVQTQQSLVNTPRRVPLDQNTTIAWVFDSSNPYTNMGMGSALTLSVIGGASVNQRTGIFGQALNVISGSSGVLTSGSTSVGESNSITVSCWVYLRSYTSYGTFCIKNYNTSTWASPYLSVGLNMATEGDGTWYHQTCTGGVIHAYGVTSATDRIPLREWTLLAMTYDSTTGVMCAYKNGALVDTRTITAANLDWGSHGPWYVGGNGTNGSPIDGMIDDVRIESVPRSQSYLETMYRRGLGLFDAYGLPRALRDITPVVANYTLSNVDDIISVGTLTAGITLTLPASPVRGQSHRVKDSGGTLQTYNVTVAGNGYLIDGISTFLMEQNYGSFEFVFNGTSWMVF